MRRIYGRPYLPIGSGAGICGARTHGSAQEAVMVALGIIFGFIAIICVLNLIEFKRVD
jgi:hypothetical protein